FLEAFIISTVATCGHRDAESGSSGRSVAFHDAAMRSDDFRHQSEPQAGAVGLGGDERIKDDLLDIVGNAWTIVMHAEFQWQGHPFRRARYGQSNARAERRR